MKTFSRFLTIGVGGICLFSSGNAQDFGTRQAIDSLDFYVFTEAGGQYIPSIQFKDSNYSESGSYSENVEGVALSASGTFSAQVSDFVVQPAIGYNFILGFGYQINQNLSIELEAGYAQSRITSGSCSYNESVSGDISVNGSSIANGTLSFDGTRSLNGSVNLTQIPILIGLAVQERSEKFQPMASVGFGVCPSIMSGNITQGSFNGTLTASGPGGSVSLPFSGITAIDNQNFNTSTAYPFAFKLKAGFDYVFDPSISLGVRAWAMGLANSNFGDQMQADLYGSLGLNAALKFRF